MPENLLSIQSVSKYFPGVQALRDVSLDIRKGEVHALLGENGAGKSTLMKILYGLYSQDRGTIEFKGRPYRASNPNEALKAGIAMIPQEISPVPNLTVAENLFLGREEVWNLGLGIVKSRKLEDRARALFAEFGVDIDVTAKMSAIPLASAQLVAIAMAVSYDADLIIMDEPTSSLTEKEVNHLFRIIEDIRTRRGISIIYISHKLDEVFAIADRATVLRDGEVVAVENIGDLTKEKLIHYMVGRDMSEYFHKEKALQAKPGPVILSVQNLTKRGKFSNVSFDLHEGEILGIAGLVGAGRTEVMEALFGFHPADSGYIFIRGERVDIRQPMDAISRRIGFVTEDRKLTGLFLSMGVKENMVMPGLDKYIRSGLLMEGGIRSACTEQVRAMDVKTPSLEQLIVNLSGGNQQKVLIARWLLMQPDILILDEPTRGIDIGAKANIHELIRVLAGMGKGILMVSSEMPEILSMSDRIITMHDGRISGGLDRSEATSQKIMRLATGEAIQ